MQTATELPRIPLSALHLSPLNARKTRGGPVDDLAANIAALEQQAPVDMARWWSPNAESFTGQVPKALVLEAVTEACGKEAAAKIAGLKKDALASEAAKLLAGTGWLPKPLRGANYGKAKPAAASAKKAATKKKPIKKPAKKAGPKKPAAKTKRKES